MLPEVRKYTHGLTCGQLTLAAEVFIVIEGLNSVLVFVVF